jgi:hypothetical protein
MSADTSSGNNSSLREALQLLLDHVDYTAGACRPNEMIGALLPIEVINRCKQILAVGDATC